MAAPVWATPKIIQMAAKGRAERLEREAVAMKNARDVNKVSWSLRKVPGGYDGTIWLPAGKFGAIPATAFAPIRAPGLPGKQAAKSSAIAAAAGMAEQIATNPLLSAVMPPGTSAAIKGIGLVAKHGPDIIGKAGGLIGKGAKRLASALKFW